MVDVEKSRVEQDDFLEREKSVKVVRERV
jgi:hypothetical protein